MSGGSQHGGSVAAPTKLREAAPSHRGAADASTGAAAHTGAFLPSAGGSQASQQQQQTQPTQQKKPPQAWTTDDLYRQRMQVLTASPPPDQCPPCFDCHLSMYPCLNFGNCSDVTGKCNCPAGFGSNDCAQPLCGHLGQADRPVREPEGKCECPGGWDGINCNVCSADSVCDALVPGGQNGTCYNSMNPVNTNHVLCDVTNKAIVDQTKDRPPKISLSCDKSKAGCEFQFWAGNLESFYCKMSECAFTESHTASSNHTSFTCPHMQCKCYPGRLLCEHDRVDFSEWFNDPEEGPNGPGTFECDESMDNGRVSRTCKFTEPHMNEVIESFFGDPYITLSCPLAGECLHYTQVPGYERPAFDAGFSPLVIALMSVGGVGLILIVLFGLVWLQRKSDHAQGGYVQLDTEESQTGRDQRETLMADHLPCTIMFRDLSYMIETDRLIPNPSRNQRPQPANGDANGRTAAPPGSDGANGNLSDTAHHSDSEAIDLSRQASTELPVSAGPSSGRMRKQKMVVLEGVQGMVAPGQVMAIMGGSGAGKTTFLDILARKNKRGIVSGDILVNGRFMDNQEYRSIIGYVDQEDTLMDTLTVYETILYSALLRLPKTMPYDAKVKRVEETMLELDILPIANRRIGSSGKRGISGGEKRRVSIACELVTSPSILFLDEPTSGLDTYNAYNVIESLVALARNYQRTVIFTIHQPRSNIYALFDQLVLLSKGRVAYSGPAQDAVIEHFAQLGFECPLGFNIADYLVDLTMHVSSTGQPNDADADQAASATSAIASSQATPLLSTLSEQFTSPEFSGAPASPVNRRRSAIRALQEDQLFSRKPHADGHSPHRPRSTTGDGLANDSSSTANGITLRVPQAAADGIRRVRPAGAAGDELSSGQPGVSRAGAISARREQNRNAPDPFAAVVRPQMSEQLSQLIQAYTESSVGTSIRQQVAQTIAAAYPAGAPRSSYLRGSTGHSAAASLSNISMRLAGTSVSDMANRMGDAASNFFGYSQSPAQRARISGWSQFMILSGRTFKNLYRNPDLLRTQYLLSVVVALICGFLYWKVDDTLAGFQNRLGIMFFICSVFGFACLSSMHVFATERLIFVRERANRYYSPITYFIPKILFDVVPMRVVPPLILGLICYHMIGLRSEVTLFLRFLLVLVLFNMTAASVCLAISIIFKDMGVASLVATLVMLFEMLFGGLLLNKSSIPPAFQWLQRLSFFNYAFEALVVNEVNGLTLVEKKFGLNIDVPGSLVLQEFGLNALAYWDDVKLLCIMTSVSFGVAFLWLQFIVKERR